MHRLRALILAGTPEQRALLAAVGARVVRISDALLLVPICLFDGDLGARVDAQYPGGEKGPSGSCRALTGPIARLAKQLSHSAPVAYVETDYFGGGGSQAATVWSAGQRVLRRARARCGPVDDALEHLGVQRARAQDEFDTVGLGRHRDTGSWLGEATDP